MVASSFLASLASLWQLLHFFTFTNFVCSTSFRLTNLSFDNTNAQPQCQTETISPIHASPLQSRRLHLLSTILYLQPPLCVLAPMHGPPLPPAALAWPLAACIIEAARPRGCMALQQHTWHCHEPPSLQTPVHQSPSIPLTWNPLSCPKFPPTWSNCCKVLWPF